MARYPETRVVPTGSKLPPRFKAEVWVAPGLSRAEALRRAKLKLPYRYDYRGFTYDAETGRCAFV